MPFGVANDKVLVLLALGVGADPVGWGWKVWSKVGEDEGDLVRNSPNPTSRGVDRYGVVFSKASFDFGETINSTASGAFLDVVVPVSIVMFPNEFEPF